jgi:8-oxo-dGTP pyrophosphatase MutT (NUDIX family)
MIFKVRPKDFKPAFEAVGCFIESNSDILLLHRHGSKPQGNTWGLPAGKIDPGEEPLESVVREIREETGYIISYDNIKPASIVYVRYPEHDFVYHIFRTSIDKKRKVLLSDGEHIDFRWISPSRALDMPLVQDLAPCIQLVFNL